MLLRRSSAMTVRTGTPLQSGGFGGIFAQGCTLNGSYYYVELCFRADRRGHLDSGQFGRIGDPSSALHAGCGLQACLQTRLSPVSVGVAKPLAGAIRTPLALWLSKPPAIFFDWQNVHRIPSAGKQNL